MHARCWTVSAVISVRRSGEKPERRPRLYHQRLPGTKPSRLALTSFDRFGDLFHPPRLGHEREPGATCVRICRLGPGEQGEQFGATGNLRVRRLEAFPLFARGHEPTCLIERGFQTRRGPERPIEERVAKVSPCRTVLAAKRGPVRSGSRDHEGAPVSERGHEHARVARRNDHDAILRPARIEHLAQFNWGESVFATPRNDGESIRATVRGKNDNQDFLVAVHRRPSRLQARGDGACGSKCAALAVETDNRFHGRSEPRLQNPRCSPRFAFKNAFWPKQSEGDDVGVAEALTRTWDRLRGYSAPDVEGKRRSRGAKHRAPSQQGEGKSANSMWHPHAAVPCRWTFKATINALTMLMVVPC